MTNPAPHDDHRVRRWFFIGVQITLLLAWGGLASQASAVADFSFWALIICIVLLLFVLPWFWSTLRHVALVGWLLGAASVASLVLRSNFIR